MMKNNIKSFAEINLSSITTNPLQDFNRHCRILDDLNAILTRIIPKQLKDFCHIGAIKEDEGLIVLFVTRPEAHHLIKNYVETILRTTTEHNYDFDKVLIKNSKYQVKPPIVVLNKKLSKEKIESLNRLAELINKPNLVNMSYNYSYYTDDKEISF